MFLQEIVQTFGKNLELIKNRTKLLLIEVYGNIHFY